MVRSRSQIKVFTAYYSEQQCFHDAQQLQPPIPRLLAAQVGLLLLGYRLLPQRPNARSNHVRLLFNMYLLPNSHHYGVVWNRLRGLIRVVVWGSCIDRFDYRVELLNENRYSTAC